MDRSRLYKNLSKDADHMRRRRQDQSMELRKLKKEMNLNKKRNIDVCDIENLDPSVNANSDYTELVKNMQSPDTEVRFKATQKARQALSQARNPPIDEFVKLGAVKILINNLDDAQPVLFETAWALTNIASGTSENTVEVVKMGAIPKLIKLLSHPNEMVADQCVWALGNIAGDCSELRNAVIDANIIPPTIELLNKTYKNETIVKNIAWMLSNLLRHKNPSPPKKVLLALLPVFKGLLNYKNCDDVVSDAAWAVSYASDSSHGYADTLIESGILSDVTPLLFSKEPKFIHPSLRIFGNLVIGEDKQTQQVLEYNFLPALRDILMGSKNTMTKEVCWLLSNVAAGTEEQKQMLITNDLIVPILQLMEKGEHRVRKETCWCISNMIYAATPAQMEYLLNNDVLKALGSALRLQETKMIELVLDTLTHLFEYAQNVGIKDKVTEEFEICKGLDNLEELQTHMEERIYNKSCTIIEKYFEPEPAEDLDESGEQNVQPDQGDQIKFSMPNVNQQFDI